MRKRTSDAPKIIPTSAPSANGSRKRTSRRATAEIIVPYIPSARIRNEPEMPGIIIAIAAATPATNKSAIVETVILPSFSSAKFPSESSRLKASFPFCAACAGCSVCAVIASVIFSGCGSDFAFATDSVFCFIALLFSAAFLASMSPPKNFIERTINNPIRKANFRSTFLFFDSVVFSSFAPSAFSDCC